MHCLPQILHVTVLEKDLLERGMKMIDRVSMKDPRALWYPPLQSLHNLRLMRSQW